MYRILKNGHRIGYIGDFTESCCHGASKLRQAFPIGVSNERSGWEEGRRDSTTWARPTVYDAGLLLLSLGCEVLFINVCESLRFNRVIKGAWKEDGFLFSGPPLSAGQLAPPFSQVSWPFGVLSRSFHVRLQQDRLHSKKALRMGTFL